jgi:hypothetical protein
MWPLLIKSTLISLKNKEIVSRTLGILIPQKTPEGSRAIKVKTSPKKLRKRKNDLYHVQQIYAL